MIIQVDFYKRDTGKWYDGGRVDVGDTRPIDADFLDVVLERQAILAKRPDLRNDYYIVTDNVDEDYAPGAFAKRLY